MSGTVKSNSALSLFHSLLKLADKSTAKQQ